MGRRPAVSTSTTSRLRALPAATASKLSAAGSPPALLTISTRLRSAHTANCSRAAARKVSAAASSTFCPASLKCRVNLPMEVVLPAPLTPATMMTVGVCSPMTSGFCSGCSKSAMASTNSARTCAGSLARAALARSRKSASKKPVACMPASAMSKASCSSSYSDSSTWLAPKAALMLLPVFFKPALRRLSQSLRSGVGDSDSVGSTAAAGAVWAAAGATSADAGAAASIAAGAGAAAETVADATSTEGTAAGAVSTPGASAVAAGVSATGAGATDTGAASVGSAAFATGVVLGSGCCVLKDSTSGSTTCSATGLACASVTGCSGATDSC